MKKKTKGDEREELLTDPQRRINLKVSLSRFKLTPVNIRKAILSMDEQTLTPQMVEHLIELIGPMEKERPKMLDFNGEPGSLTNC